MTGADNAAEAAGSPAETRWRPRAALAGLPTYRAGSAGPAARFKVSSNERHVAPAPSVITAVTDGAAAAHRYPDIAAGALTEELAAALGVARDRVCVGNGSVALLQQVVQAACDPGDEVVFAWRSFEAYPIITQIAGARGRAVPLTPSAEHDLGAMRGAITRRTKVVMLCSPNNPTGPALRTGDVRAFLDRVPGSVLVVLDEAYREYVTDPDGVDGLDLLEDYPNLVTMRTFSKAYGLAGLRVGYAVGTPAVVAAIASVGIPFGVSAVAQAAARAAWADRESMRRVVAGTTAQRERMVASLGAAGVQLPQAQGNFVWVPAGGSSADLAEAFGTEGLAVRHFPGEGVRVTVGEPEANDVAVAVLTRWFDRGGAPTTAGGS